MDGGAFAHVKPAAKLLPCCEEAVEMGKGARLQHEENVTNRSRLAEEHIVRQIHLLNLKRWSAYVRFISGPSQTVRGIRKVFRNPLPSQ